MIAGLRRSRAKRLLALAVSFLAIATFATVVIATEAWRTARACADAAAFCSLGPAVTTALARNVVGGSLLSGIICLVLGRQAARHPEPGRATLATRLIVACGIGAVLGWALGLWLRQAVEELAYAGEVGRMLQLSAYREVATGTPFALGFACLLALLAIAPDRAPND